MVSFWPAWSSMLWCENSQAVHSIGFVHMPTTSTAWKRISKATRAALHSTELCRCLREFFWCWILQSPPGRGAQPWPGMVARELTRYPVARLRMINTSQCDGVSGEGFAGAACKMSALWHCLEEAEGRGRR